MTVLTNGSIFNWKFVGPTRCHGPLGSTNHNLLDLNWKFAWSKTLIGSWGEVWFNWSQSVDFQLVFWADRVQLITIYRFELRDCRSRTRSWTLVQLTKSINIELRICCFHAISWSAGWELEYVLIQLVKTSRFGNESYQPSHLSRLNGLTIDCLNQTVVYQLKVPWPNVYKFWNTVIRKNFCTKASNSSHRYLVAGVCYTRRGGKSSFSTCTLAEIIA